MARRVVLDSDVIVAGLRSRRGASFRLLSLVGTGVFTHCLSVSLLFEYEDVLKRPGLVPIGQDAVEDVLDGLCATAERTKFSGFVSPSRRM
jgi:predicted nucleic acid-binding protein